MLFLFVRVTAPAGAGSPRGDAHRKIKGDLEK